MSDFKAPDPAKLVIGMFMQDKAVFEPVLDGLMGHYGAVDYISRWLPFDDTDYYRKEMGGELWRRLVAFGRLIDQGVLADIKHVTCQLEKQYCRQDRRQINIDPGYLLASRFVLATGKDFMHRIYIGRQVYADLTLVYQDGGYRTLPWTYPDYGGHRVQRVLRHIRGKYMADRLPAGRPARTHS